MRAVVIFVLSFVASILGYQILTPNDEVGWTNSGPQNVTWIRVDTDSSTFTAVLTNQVITGFTSQTLATNVDGTTGSTQFSPPGGTFPTGSGFRLDFVNTQELDTILAQSNQYNITDASSTSGTSGTTGTTVTATSSPTSQTGSSDSSGTSAGIIPTSSASSTSTNSTSGAASSYRAQTGLLVLFSFLGFALA